MSSNSQPDFVRERRLIEQLEFRIAAAESSEKLQTILQKFLAALVLKLASENAENRNLTIKVCQYVSQRLKLDQTIQLPVEALSKTFNDTSNAFVKQFSLLFIQQGLARLPPKDGIAVLPGLLRSSIQTRGYSQSDKKMLAISVNHLLSTLSHWKPPEHGSREDEALKSSYQLLPEQTGIIAKQLSNFLLYDPKALSEKFDAVPEEIRLVFETRFPARTSIVPNIALFVFTSIFEDEERFIPATILSVDANAAASSRADVMFKQCNFDLESDTLVDNAFDLYLIAKPRLQTRILSLLARSKTSVSRTTKIVHIIESQLSEPVTSLEASKLRAATFAYLIWAIQVSSDISVVAQRLQSSLKEFIEMQGWPESSLLSPSDTELRAKAYESIGLLSSAKGIHRQDLHLEMDSSSTTSTFELVAWLFTSLRCDTARDVRHSIDESLSRLMTSTTIDNKEDLKRFKALLFWNIMAMHGDEDPIYHMPTQNLVQYPAVRFANKILPLSDADGRIINLIALTSQKKEVVEEGQRGLDPSWHAANARIGGAYLDSASILPTFEEFATKLFNDEVHSFDTNLILDQPSALSGAAIFARNLLANESWQGTRFTVQDDPDWTSKIDALLENEDDARKLFRLRMNAAPKASFLQLLRLCYRGMGSGSVECGRVGLQLTSLASNEVLQGIEDSILAHLDTAASQPQLRYFACRILGIVLSLSPLWENSVRQALSICEGWHTAAGQKMVEVEVSLLKGALILSRVALRNHIPSASSVQLVDTLWGLCSSILAKATDKGLRQSTYTTISQLALCLAPTTVPETDSLVEIMHTDAKKENEAAVTALGRFLSLVWSHLLPEMQKETLAKIYNLHEVRKAEFHLALGEALAVASLRFKSSSTLAEFDVDAELLNTANDDLFTQLLTDILQKSRTTKPALKKATGMWLLSLVQFCGSSDLLKPYLQELQAAFSRLLADRDEIVQETGSRGLGLVYENGDKGLRDDLVRDLVQSFTGSNAKTAGTVSEDTQLFEQGALPTENGHSVTTYKDIVSLAQEMGDPSLVYRFMNLASNNAIWTSRAAFGRFGLSGVLADSTYLKENKKFYPKLFRYRFDPNPNVQRSMNEIWKALVKDPNAIIDENFDLIMEDLLQSIVSGREWRAREASCGAISDLIQGREVEKFQKYLDQIWKVAFKVLDDVKETVRNAAMKLCRTLTNMLIRNLEVGEGTTKRAAIMLAHAVPFLLQQMDAGAGKEVQQYAVVTLLDITKKAPLKSLQSFAPRILETFLNSLSSLEHESINYLHLNADKYGLTTEKLDNMRVSSIGASPVTEAIEKCLASLTFQPSYSADPDEMQGIEGSTNALEDALKRLEGSFKTTIGLPSRVGLSRIMITLVVRYHAAFRPFVDRFVRLTRKCVLDRNDTISQSFSSALAYLLRLASEKEVRQTISYAQKLYFESQEVSHRAVAGEIVQAISKASGDVFINFSSLLLPFAFIGRKDFDDDARERFDTAWKDNVGGSRALHLYLKEIADLVIKHIKSSMWPIRHACCFAVADLVSNMESGHVYNKDEAALLWPLFDDALSGKTWEGKEKVVLSFPKFVERAGVIWDERTSQMKKIIVREAKRKNKFYQPHALAALGEFAKIRLDLDMSAEVVPFLVEVVDDLSSGDPDSMDVDDTPAQNSRTR